MAAVGRNDPCPCGSGKKYKKCHLDEDAAAERDAPPARARALHAADGRLVQELAKLARARFGARWDPVAAWASEVAGDPEHLHVLGPWSLHHLVLDGKTVADWYRAAPPEGRVAAEPEAEADARLLDAHAGAYFSVWEVTGIVPGESLALLDRLTGAALTVHERTATKGLHAGEALLARVVTSDGVSILTAAHPVPLLPQELGPALARIRRDLGAPEHATLTAADLRRPGAAAVVLRAWYAYTSALRA